jgi:hypothetical protein
VGGTINEGSLLAWCHNIIKAPGLLGQSRTRTISLLGLTFPSCAPRAEARGTVSSCLDSLSSSMKTPHFCFSLCLDPADLCRDIPSLLLIHVLNSILIPDLIPVIWTKLDSVQHLLWATLS